MKFLLSWRVDGFLSIGLHTYLFTRSLKMFRIVLVNPEIPPNTGNVIRLTANTGCELHLVGPLGFNFDDKHMRRAGLDYHELANLKQHANWDAFLAQEKPKKNRMFTLTTKGQETCYQKKFVAGDWLVFGCETKGLSQEVRSFFDSNNCLRLPMRANQRSLNLSNSVAIAVYEAWRQNDFQ